MDQSATAANRAHDRAGKIARSGTQGHRLPMAAVRNISAAPAALDHMPSLHDQLAHPFFLVPGSLQISSCRAVRTPAIARYRVKTGLCRVKAFASRGGGIPRIPQIDRPHSRTKYDDYEKTY